MKKRKQDEKAKHRHGAVMDRQSPVFHGLVRGMLPMYLLMLLREGPLHGTDMIRSISEKSGHAWKPSPGSVYPILRRQEEQGLIKGKWLRTGSAPRRVYRLTAKGRSALPKMQSQLVADLVGARNIIDMHITSFKKKFGG